MNLSVQLETMNWRDLPMETDQQKALKVLAWRWEHEKFRFYKPNQPAERLLTIIGAGGNQTGIYSAVNATGKTCLVVNILASLIWGAQSVSFKKPLFTHWTFPKRVRYITDPKLVEEIGPFHSEIIKWWPKGRYDAIKGGHNYFTQYKAEDWVIDVMTYDQEVRQFEGGTLGMVIFDEPPPKDIWNASMARLRLGGILLVVMTPLTHAAWFYDEVVPKHQNDIVYATMEDACKTHGVNGHLEHKNIERMIDEMPPDEVEARAYGKALYLSGLIYKTFDTRVHVLKEPFEAPSNATIYQAVDPHTDKPFACIWAYPDPAGNLYIVDEWPNVDFNQWRNCQLGIKDYAEIFRQKERGLQVHKRIIDRHFAVVRSVVNKKTLIDAFRQDCDIDFTPSYRAAADEEEVEVGIVRVMDYLKYDSNRPIDTLNHPKIYINPHCMNTIKSFQRWAYDQKTGKPTEHYKDFMDCIRYMVMANPEIDTPAPYIPPRKMGLM